jgi:hypothetical protein
MNLNCVLYEPDWHIVASINKNTVLKGIADRSIRDLLESCREHSDTCGCFCWSTRSFVYRCEAFARNYQDAVFKSNLEGCMHSAFSVDSDPLTRCPGEPSLLYQRMNRALEEEDLFLMVLHLNGMQFLRERLDHAQFSQNPVLASLVAALLTYSYRQQGQCVWT